MAEKAVILLQVVNVAHSQMAVPADINVNHDVDHLPEKSAVVTSNIAYTAMVETGEYMHVPCCCSC